MIRARPHNVIRNWLFLGALMVPGIVMLFAARQETSLREARTLASAPGRIELVEHPLQYASLWDAFLKDHFGLRDSLLDINALVRRQLESPASGQVIVGKQGWLFFGDGLLPGSESARAVEEKVTRQVELIGAIARRLDRQRIPFLVAPTPDKHSVYPEYLPGWLDRLPRSDVMRQLIAGVRAKGVELVDVGDALASSRDHSPLYFLTDTHWTPIGAALAFNEVSRLSRAVLRPVPVPSGATLVHGAPHDLSRMAGFDGTPLDWVVPGFNSSYPQALREELQVADSSLQKPFVLRRDGLGSKVLIIGDSFSGHWPSYALESANTVYWSHHNQCLADWPKLLSLDVDLVIYQMLERTIGCPPLAPEVIGGIDGLQAPIG